MRRLMVQAPSDVAAWLEADRGVRRVLEERLARHRPRAFFFPPEGEVALRFAGLPELRTTTDVADWLGWTPEVLDGHADPAHQHRRQPMFRDYVYSWRGARLIEAPKDRLKAGQRRILRELVLRVPPHDAAHGFVEGHSPRTHAALHVGSPRVLRVDLRHFFGSITAARVRGWFRSLGYPETVASVLACLVTTWTPSDVSRDFPWSQPHLPQGAPTSPALANAVCFGLDRRLTGLARHHGAVYSRYADDLTFSGRSVPSPSAIEAIVQSEGFHVNGAKTRIMGQGVAQRVTGLVVNRHVAVSRRERDRLKALLHLCRTRGPGAVRVEGVDDLQAWLRGRISWVAHARPRHGERLLAMFDTITW